MSSNSSTAPPPAGPSKTTALAGCVVSVMALGNGTSEPGRHYQLFGQPQTVMVRRQSEGDEDSSRDEYVQSVDEMRQALLNLNEERFQVGMLSALANRVMHLVSARPYHAVLAFGTLLAENDAKVASYAEAMRWLPYMSNAVPSAVDNVVGLGLQHPAGVIRDAAIVAAEVSGSKRLLPALRRAAAQESVGEFKQDLNQLLRDIDENAFPKGSISR